MGATTYIEKALGQDVEEVFNTLVSEAEYFHGHDPYNGTISTTTLHRELNLSKDLIKAVKNGNWQVMEENDRKLYPAKWETNYIKEIKHYEAFTPTWVADKDTPRREKGVKTLTQYAIMTVTNEKYTTNGVYARIRTYAKLTDAKREAKELAISSGRNVIIKQVRSNGDLFKIGQMNLVSDNKVYKSARKTKTKTYLPVYEFTFFVYASC